MAWEDYNGIWTHQSVSENTLETKLIASTPPAGVEMVGNVQKTIFYENSYIAHFARHKYEYRKNKRTFWIVKTSLNAKKHVLLIDHPVNILFSVSQHVKSIDRAIAAVKELTNMGISLKDVDYGKFKESFLIGLSTQYIIRASVKNK